ncbi:NAD(P)-binding protein [Dendrothele bispora CBS 962.96]|uniref:NAD(P)-binding protein n=1 Tax=Dendrothele bispora (strain CBS 962.96) TaxID=1314807 RepID=A0A4S8M0B3_DENBC|nr:NAD(P)-binding protein [Dendrothele bispora CBS 962.96]
MPPYAAPPATFNPVKDLPDMKGKIVIVTGSSSGIGFASLQHFSRMGAKVYMAVPDEERTKQALERVEREGREPGLGEVIWHELDLKDPRTVKLSAQRFLEREERLDILINNAALFVLSMTAFRIKVIPDAIR